MWIITAWLCISPQVILKGFKRCYTSKAVDKTDDEIPWDGSEEEWNVRCEGEDDEGTD